MDQHESQCLIKKGTKGKKNVKFSYSSDENEVQLVPNSKVIPTTEINKKGRTKKSDSS